MGDNYSCTYPDCGRVFTRAYELKKHKATHDDPDSVFHCPQCDFITLQKKNLGIHFAIHTGEKSHECPDVVSLDDGERRCDYRTNDPAALSKHRKKVHGYIPPPNRSRPRAPPTSPQTTRQMKDGRVSRRCRRIQRAEPAPRRKASRSPWKTRNPGSGRGKPSEFTNPTPFHTLENVDGGTMEVDCCGDFGYNSGVATLGGTDDGMGLDTLFDPSLRSQWMEKYEMSYSPFDMIDVKQQPESLLEDPSLGVATLDVGTGREGCLCPEWMVEAGIEGWDASILEDHKGYHVIDA